MVALDRLVQDRIPELIYSIRRWCGDRLFFLLACVAGVVCLYAVPQVTRLIRQPPTHWVDFLLFLTLLAFLALFYLITLIDLVRPFQGKGLTAWVRITNGWVMVVAETLKSQSAGVRGYVFPAAMVAAGVAISIVVPFEYAVPYPLAGAAVRMFGAWFAMTGMFLLYGKLMGPDIVLAWSAETRHWRRKSAQEFQDELPHAVQRGTSRLDQSTREARSGWDLLGAVLSWLFVTTLIGEVLWSTAAWGVPFASLRLYTIWAVVHVLVTAAVFGGVIDFFHRYTVLPARTFAVVVIFLGAWFQSGEVIRDKPVARSLSAGTVAASTVAAPASSSSEGDANAARDADCAQRLGPLSDDPWLRHLQLRLACMPEGPVVLVAASGGGSRAALFTSLVLDLFRSEPMGLPAIESRVVVPPDGAGTTAASGAQASAPGSMWSDHVLMISSVSGGSIATARYVDAASAHSEIIGRTHLQHTDRDELITRTVTQLEDWAQMEKDPNAPAVQRLKSVKAMVSELGSTPPATNAPVATNATVGTKAPGAAKNVVPSSGDEEVPPVNASGLLPADEKRFRDVIRMAFQSRFADDMCADFMAPLLRGFLTPWTSRGQGLFHFWESEFGWTDVRLSRPLTTPEMKSRPLVLFNTTDVDSGRRVVMGYPSLPSAMWRARQAVSLRSQRLSGLLNEGRYAPMAASMFVGGSLDDMPLARAVRLSSNFPFGFPVAEVRVAETDASATAARPERYRFLDGGVVDNTGIDSLHAVFSDLHRAAVDDPLGDVARVLAEIRRRGVVFVEIDSGAKPSASTDRNSPFSSIGRPLSALNNATYTNALRSSDYFTRDLSRILSHWIPAVLLKSPHREPMNVPFGSIELSVKQDELAWAIPAITADYSTDLRAQSVLSVQFVCNHISRSESHVMTALALGPQDKAAIIAQFLDQCHEWRSAPQSQSRKVFFSNKQELGQQLVSGRSENEAARLAIRDLLRAADTEMVEALALLSQIARDSGWKDQQPTKEQLEAVKPIVMRPYLLLMGVRVLAEPGSDEFEQKGQQLTELERSINQLITVASEGEILTTATGVVAADPSSPANAETRFTASEAIRKQLEVFRPADSGELMQSLGSARQQNASIQLTLDFNQAANRSFYENLGKEPVTSE